MIEQKAMTMGTYAWREIEDGRFLAVVPLTFGRARVVIAASIDENGYDDLW